MAPTSLSSSAPTSGGSPKAGRNLPAAIAVGVILGGLIVGSLWFHPAAWVAFYTVAVLIGVGELTRAFAHAKVRVPLVPCLVGTAAIGPAALVGGPGALLLVTTACLLGLVLWRSARGLDGAARDVSAGAFVIGYGPFQAAFTALMVAIPGDGPLRVVTFVLVTVSSDIGGYAVGVLAGKHPMAPSISPKKSWEGFAGSCAACVMCGAISVPALLGGAAWAGALFGLVMVVLGTIGDLVESMIKRDLGVKDLGTILPGHGGLMDRIDSLLVAAPAAWLLLLLMVPPA
ncbi:MAG: phosphatidate cytidylyltransferase [Dermatophilaceae bacterium]